MKYIYKHASLPHNPALAAVLENSCADLETRLRQLDINTLPLSDYGKRYYAYDMRKIRFMLQSYAFMLMWMVHRSGKKKEELTLVDHGGGIGIFSMLARLGGIGTVIHQDLNPVVVNDASLIARALGIRVDHFVPGDMEELVAYVKTNNLQVNVFGSRNVIEHIYDLDQFFKQASQLPSQQLLLFMSTTANIRNPLVNIYTRRLQRRYDREGAPVAWGEAKVDTQFSGINQRKKIIATAFPEFKAEEVDRLSELTRGKIRADIIAAAGDYKKTGKFPSAPADRTNTCDPETGSWVEHLLPLSEYRRLIEKNGFRFDFINGFYNTAYSRKYLNLITPFLNLAIRALKKKGTFLAPFISIIAEKDR
jgi:2-polyprenyl-3-methyl-5-hydroxy-6-metoxy-1,4-benzoquinol methylase